MSGMLEVIHINELEQEQQNMQGKKKDTMSLKLNPMQTNRTVKGLSDSLKYNFLVCDTCD